MNEDSTGALFLFGAITALVLIIGWKRGFFSHSFEEKWIVPIRLVHVLAVFLIYFGIAILVMPFIRTFFIPTKLSPLSLNCWLNFLNSTLIASGIAWFTWKTRPPLWPRIWQRDVPAYKKDVETAIFAWVIAFPLVLFLSQFLDLLVTHLTHATELPDQLAVHFLKMTFSQPFYFFLTVTTVVFFAPLIEETMFRGLLQSFIRQHLGSKQAIGITSLLFAFFHYSPEQGLGNVPIIGALFVLALFLGYLYEKRGSLLAPITLHAVFNAISVANLYFLGGFPKGPL